MKTVERAKGWLHGDVDCDPRQLVRDLVDMVESQGATCRAATLSAIDEWEKNDGP